MEEQYGALLRTLGILYDFGKQTLKNRSLMSDFVGYLSKNDLEISKFAKVTSELQDYLDRYDFTQGFQFYTMQQKLEALSPLRLKLSKMGEEARKLANFPDRYGSKKAMEVCKALVINCMQKMSLDETAKVAALVDSNTQKLIDIQKLFARDGGTLAQINELIASKRAVLEKFKAYYSELQQYVKEFPHGMDDFSVVKGRIDTAEQLLALWSSVSKVVDVIRPYSDRHNKGSLLAGYQQLVDFMAKGMRYADVENCKLRLNEVKQKVQSAINAFAAEEQELRDIRLDLMSKSVEFWKNDKEMLLREVDRLLSVDYRKENFDVGQLKNRVVGAKQKRSSDIKEMLNRYPWLEHNDNYNMIHTKLLKKQLSYDQYLGAVDELRSIRIKRIICWCIPIIGWFFLMPEIKCPTV